MNIMVENFSQQSTHTFVLVHGSYQTFKGDPDAVYETITLSELEARIANPTALEKRNADFILASSFNGYLARNYAEQRRHGVYSALIVDVDTGNIARAALEAALERVCGACYVLIYSSSGATPEALKWRAIVPLAAALTGAEYPAAANALYDALEAHGVPCDRTLARWGQPCYLMNVPPDKRGPDGAPISYDHVILDGEFLDAHAVFGDAMADIMALNQYNIDQIKTLMDQTKAHDPNTPWGYASLNFPLDHLLDQFGYEAKGGTYGGFTDDWKSPYSSGYSTRVYGDVFVTLSYSDAERGVGRVKGPQAPDGAPNKYKYRWGSSLDLIAHYQFGGDMAAATAAIEEMIREDWDATTAKVGAAVAKMADEAGVDLPNGISKSNGASMDGLRAYDFAKWVFLQNRVEFYDLETGAFLKPVGFNLAFNRHVPYVEDDKGKRRRPKADVYHTEVLEVPTVYDVMYWPGRPAIFSEGRQDWANAYLPNAMSPLADTDEGGQIILAHIKNLVPDDWETVVNWMAFNVQQPGEKIRWALLLKGIEGDGKSTLADTLSAVLGKANVKAVSNSVLHGRFNGFAGGSQVVVLEELRAEGKSRFDVLTALKPLVTNDWVDVERKGRDAINVRNFSNYLAFTNHADALPLSEADRRYYVAFTRFNDRETMLRETGDGYFEKIRDVLNHRAGEVRAWLESVDLSSFNANVIPAGGGSGKQQMIAAGVSDDVASIEEALARSKQGVTARVILTAKLGDVLKDMGEPMRTSRMAKALGRMGFEKIGWDVKITTAQTVYVKRGDPILSMDQKSANDAIRAEAGQKVGGSEAVNRAEMALQKVAR